MIIKVNKLLILILIIKVMVIINCNVIGAQEILHKKEFSPQLLYLEALIEQQCKNFGKAIVLFNEVINVDPTSAWAYYGIGECYYARGDITHSVQAFDKTTRLKSDYIQAYLSLIEIYEQYGEWGKAKECYTRVIEIDPELYGACHNLGLIYFELEEWEEALDLFCQEIAVDPYSHETYYMMGLVYSDLEEWDMAIQAFSVVEQLAEEIDCDIYYRLGLAFKKLGRYQEAEKVYKQAINANPFDYTGYIGLGLLYEEAGRLNDAMEEYIKAINLGAFSIPLSFGNHRVYFRTIHPLKLTTRSK